MEKSKEVATKTYSLRVTENALQNIDNITGYNAIRVGDEILKTFDRIENNPLAFRECEGIPTVNKIYRKAICLSWIIIYKIKPAEIVILGIIHGHRRPRSSEWV